MNAGDTGFMLICTAFVFFMTPGLAFFYGGLVRRKNVVNTMMACGAIMGLSVVMWTLFGYSLAFGTTIESIGIENAVAFGCCMPGEETRMHGPDERISVETLLTSGMIFTEAVARLCR